MPPIVLPPVLVRITAHRSFKNGYALLSVVLLSMVAAFVGYQGALVQQSNADQIVNPYLFENSHVMHGAQYPSQHTFLLKWPLFFIIHLFHSSNASYRAMTVAVMLVTIGSMALLLRRIERRPLVFGTLCLALASTLLLIPAQPYVGGILPTNMAMVATRNIEYIVFILSIVLLTWPERKQFWRYAAGATLLGLLIVSDQLFLSLSIGASLVALIAYAVRNRTAYIAATARWFGGSILAALLSGLIIVGLKSTHVVGIVTVAAPFGLVTNLKTVLVGIIYAIAGLFTNFGANPAYDATQITQVPSAVLHRLLSVGGPAYVVNISILLACNYAVGQILLRAFLAKSPKAKPPKAVFLAAMLAWTALASIALYVVSNHYYAVDSRYMTIIWFAGFICLAVMLRSKRLLANRVLVCGVILMGSIGIGVYVASQTSQSQQAAYQQINSRNHRIIQVLTSRKMPVLVGDYWRVLPIRQQSRRPVTIQPLATCTQLRTVLVSQVWRQNIDTKPFAYLLSLDKSLTDFPQCSITQVVTAYGTPNESVLIAGTLSKPTELLLFFDKSKKPNATEPIDTATILPIAASALPGTDCRNATTMNFVAHEDDDILFMNPDITVDLQSGRCVRTVYVTAGDSGYGAAYLASREQGSQAAYATLLHSQNDWLQRIVRLPRGEYVRVSTLKDHPEVSLIFMRLPDGGLDGGGFAKTKHQSLNRLETGRIANISSVDQQSGYTKSGLESALAEIMALYNPAEIRTQSSAQGNILRDHSDHGSVGRFVTLAHDVYQQQIFDNLVSIPITYYVGYPIRESPTNVDGPLYTEKLAAFLAYAQYDAGVCQTVEACNNTPTYGSYLQRQYQSHN
ncbi:PIG-L family deacetylase [Candidatus Saccharibacteria bacterium]|nr:PIG-L family deacetylase [Candidatus Saccharibacteria bacterium]